MPKITCLLLLAAHLWAAAPAQAMFMRPQQVPVERLLRSAQAYLAAHPQEADAHYTLARIHYLAFARGSTAVPAFREVDEAGKPLIPGDSLIDFDLYEARQARADELALRDLGERGPRVPPERASAFAEARGKRARQLEAHNWQPKGRLGPAEMLAHAAAAQAAFREAQRLEPANGLDVLGLASLAEQFADWAEEQKPAGRPPELSRLDHAQARAGYLAAYRLTFPKDVRLEALDVSGIAGLVSHEAGKAYVRLTERDAARLKPEDEKTLREVKAGLQKLQKIPLGAVTPIVFSPQPAESLEALLAPGSAVDFDLRGFGSPERWPWVRPTTGFLVWDPAGQGEIRSAQQLFGGYTFQIFRSTGYHALAALDGDGDGWLSGPELHGIRAWFDANGDGVSAPSEVRDLAALGITGIATEAAGWDGPHPTNAQGLRRVDGSFLPTWDWMAQPLPSDFQMSTPTTQANK